MNLTEHKPTSTLTHRNGGDPLLDENQASFPKAFPLTEAEETELRKLRNPRSAIKRYMKLHRNDKCPVCTRYIGNHTLKQFSRCLAKSHDSD